MSPATRLAAPDQDLLAVLERRDEVLSALVHEAQKYRHVVRFDLGRLRAGADPAGVRATVERWAGVLRGLKRLAREL